MQTLKKGVSNLPQKARYPNWYRICTHARTHARTHTGAVLPLLQNNLFCNDSMTFKEAFRGEGNYHVCFICCMHLITTASLEVSILLYLIVRTKYKSRSMNMHLSPHHQGRVVRTPPVLHCDELIAFCIGILGGLAMRPTSLHFLFVYYIITYCPTTW